MKIGRWSLALCLTFTFVAMLPAVDQAQVASAVVYYTPGDDAEGAIVAKIEAAKQSIYVMAYSFTSVPIAKSLAAAAARKVDVHVILDKSNEGAKYGASDYIAGRVAEVLCDFVVAIAHNKVMIIDERTVITGSFNFTKAAQKSNAENLLILESTDLAKSYRANWERRRAVSRPFVRKADRPESGDQ